MNPAVIKAFENTSMSEVIKNQKISDPEKIAKAALVSNGRGKLVPIVLEKMALFQKEKWAVKLAVKFDKKYKKYKNFLSQNLQTDCEKTLGLFKGAIEKKAAEERDKQLNKHQDPSIGIRPFYEYPKEWSTIAQLKEQLKNPERLEALVEGLKRRTENLDQHLIDMPHQASKAYPDLCPHSCPFDFNRAGKDIDGLFINVSHVKIPNSQSYLLGCCPKTLKDARNSFDVILKENVKVLISVHQPSEIIPTGAFWAKEVLEPISNPKPLLEPKLRDGWAIRDTEKDETLATAQSEIKNNPSPVAHIIKKHLVAQRGNETRDIYVLHYKGWHDHWLPPVPSLMNDLLDQKDSFCSSIETPLWINCKAGFGRTGTVALLDLCRCEIREQMKKGCKLEEVSINIPLLLYRLRQERAGLLSNSKNFVNVYRCVVAFAESLKNKMAV